MHQGRDISNTAVTRIGSFNRRTLDVLAARVYHYYSWCHESMGQLEDIRSNLLALQRTATLRHDEIGAETLLNLLLRNYLHFNLYDQVCAES
jgi:26S proteasome regulatory subunit N3